MANIRTARRSGLVLRGGRNVRSTVWGDITGTFTTLAAGGTAVLLNVTSAGLLAKRPWTAVRARGHWFIVTDQNAAREDQGCGLGMIIVSDDAVAIGITAIPTPITQAGSDGWFMYETMMAAQGAGSTDNALGVGKNYDSKAMRRVEEGFQLVVVAESMAAGLTGGLEIRHIGRILIKLN